jgi:hypothetical protein
MQSDLDINSITFGKYKGKYLKDILIDRKYCFWLLEQDWFQTNYEYLYNKIKEYEPQKYFLKEKVGIEEIEKVESTDFLNTYKYFNLKSLNEIEKYIELSDTEKNCYKFYLITINDLKDKIIDRMIENKENPYDIKAPVKWLQNFEKEYVIPRDDFKLFLSSYELPNITTILEDIKKEGGIEYKGGKTFMIAKKNSGKQEKLWENILKMKYGEKIGTQFKYKECIFDFINIEKNIIYECKLSLKDFNKEQYNKYLITLNQFNIIYLISDDCIINTDDKIIHTTNYEKYKTYLSCIESMSKPSEFDLIIKEYEIRKIDNILADYV